MKRIKKDNINSNGYWNKKYDRLKMRGNLVVQRRVWNEVNIALKDIGNAKTVLDIGCGMGTFVCELSQDKFKAKGIDHSETSVKFANRAYGNKFKCIDITKSSLKENSVDAITCMQVLEHIEEPIDVIEKLKKACKKALIITVPNKNAIKSPEHIWEFEVKDFKDLGFRVSEFSNDKRLIAVYIKEV